MASENSAVSRRILDEVWNKRNMAVIDELVDADFIFHDPMAPQAASGVESYKMFVKANLAAFPDLHLTVHDSIGEGETVATRWTATGTHTGDLGGIPATGRTVSITGMNFSRIVNGEFVESWGSWDRLGMFQQLGLALAQVEAVEEAA